jgi:hypothetical protein
MKIVQFVLVYVNCREEGPLTTGSILATQGGPASRDDLAHHAGAGCGLSLDAGC